MASVNYLYRSTRENQDLEIRLSFKGPKNEYKVIEAESKIKIFSGEEYPQNPFWKADKYKGKENPYPVYQALVENDSGAFFLTIKESLPLCSRPLRISIK